MSQEMNQNQFQNTEENESTRKTNKNRMIILWIVIGVLLAGNIYFFAGRRNADQKLEEATSRLDTVVADRDNIQGEYDAALARLDLLVGKNAQLDSLVASKDSEIGRLRSQIQGIISNSRSTASDYARARQLIAELNSRVKTYEERIAELESDNTRLNKYNEVLIQERDSTVTTNIALSQKVRLGAVLHASNIRMTPIELKRGGRKEKETSKARKVDIFRITFDIDENRIAEDGEKEVLIRILDPENNLLSNAAYGSGVSSTFDGKNLNYTLAKTVSLKQGEPVRNIVADWNQDSDYKRGDYIIEIYNQGYKIGEGRIHLK